MRSLILSFVFSVALICCDSSHKKPAQQGGAPGVGEVAVTSPPAESASPVQSAEPTSSGAAGAPTAPGSAGAGGVVGKK
jgi:hypothetical protein